MRILCVVEKDGKILLPPVIQKYFPKSQGNVIEIEFDEKKADKINLLGIDELKEDGIPIPYEAMEAAELMDENFIEIMVMDRSIVITTPDKILELFTEECFK